MIVHGVVPWPKWLDAGLSSKTPGFDPGPPYVGFVVDKLTLGPAFSEHIGFSLVKYHSTITPHPSSSTCCSYQKVKWAKFEHSNKQGRFGNR